MNTEDEKKSPPVAGGFACGDARLPTQYSKNGCADARDVKPKKESDDVEAR